MLQFANFVLTRAFMAVMTLVIVSLVVFTLMELVPGDCAERYLAFKNTQGSGISAPPSERSTIISARVITALTSALAAVPDVQRNCTLLPISALIF